jgi:hypothetical protein
MTIDGKKLTAKWDNETRLLLGDLHHETEIMKAQMDAASDAQKEANKQATKNEMTYQQVLYRLAEDVKVGGMWQDLTSESVKPMREMAGLFIHEYVKKEGGTYNEAYATWNTLNRMALTDYWETKDMIAGKSGRELLEETAQSMKVPVSTLLSNGYNKDNIKERLIQSNKEQFDNVFKKYIPEGYPVYNPSKMQRDSERGFE